jgi:hypothetical protein
MYYVISAESEFGYRDAIYKLIEGVLVCRDQGDHDNLAGNEQVCDFEGLTVMQAREKINALNSEPVGHAYDGCHACTWHIELRKLLESEVPPHLTYNEPSEAFTIRDALQIFRRKGK